MTVELQVALVALAGALVGALLTVFTSIGAGIAGQIREANERFRNGRKIHEKYSDPLAVAATALMWRLKELVVAGGRDYYLQGSSSRTSFEQYKATSTLYRLAAVIAWNRALRREVFFLRADRRRPRTHQRELDSALDALANSLADGHRMELMRIEAVAAHLGLAVPERAMREVGATVDFELDRFVHAHGHLQLAELRKGEQRQAVSLALSVISSRCEQPIDVAAVTRSSWREIVRLLDAREAWIYRDWQSAIGDLMLVPAPAGPRGYDVIGYGEFERMWTAGNQEQKKWLNRLNTLLDGLAMDKPAHVDGRTEVMRATYRACGRVILAIDQLQGRRSPIARRDLDAATEAASFTA